MKKTIFLAILAFCILPLNCQSNEPKAPTKEDQSLQELKYCKMGCGNLEDLQCLNDETEEACTNSCVIMREHTKEMDPKCWAALISCDEMEACRTN